MTGTPNVPHRVTGRLLAAASVLLWLTSVYRAGTYPFTHDESLSFSIFTAPDSVWAATPNHHFLNTWLMWVCSGLFGNAPFALRLPNVLAHALYLGCVLRMLRPVESNPVRWAGFALFNLNLFALDFFALARGYGLGLAGTALSLALMVRTSKQKHDGLSPVRPIVGALIAGGLAVLANYVLLNIYLPLLVTGLWMLLTDASGRRLTRAHGLEAAALVVANEAFLAAVCFRMFRLQRDGQLYFGGEIGFVEDTVLSLVRNSYYREGASEAALRLAADAIVISIAGAVVIAMVHAWRGRTRSALPVMTAVLVLAVAGPILLHATAGVLFPIDRAAIGYLPLYGLVVVLALDALPGIVRGRWLGALTALSSAALAAGLSWVWWSGFDPRTCRTWAYDAHNTTVLDLVDADRKATGVESVRLGVSWVLEPSLNFYRTTRAETWLAPVDREGLADPKNQYVYFFTSETDRLPAGPHRVIASFPDTGTELWRRDGR